MQKLGKNEEQTANIYSQFRNKIQYTKTSKIFIPNMNLFLLAPTKDGHYMLIGLASEKHMSNMSMTSMNEIDL